MEVQKNHETESDNCIYLKDLLARGIHIDRVSDFGASIFAEMYENAKQSVEKIVSDNRLWQRSEFSQTEPQEIGISNVISFIGRRGTGKTSAMLSFREALDRYDGRRKYRYGLEQNGIKFDEEAAMDNVRFFSLRYIDASVLEESEDIFILVLANLLNCLNEMNRKEDETDYKFRNLLKEFETIHEDFITIKETSQHRNEMYSSYEKLMNIASSQRIRLQFYCLIKECLEYIRQKEKIESEELYLVIAIDDLDMAHYNTQNMHRSYVNNKSYEIVNCIHKYLAIPGVIVLTAYNHVNLMLQCENFFINSDTTSYQSDSDRESQRKTSTKLANQFVDKAFALNHRVYMPSWKKNDFREKRFRVDVKTGMGKNAENIFSRHCKAGEKCLTIKKFVLIMYAEKIGVYYDCRGNKIHFLEPDSLRKLSDMVALMGDLTTVWTEEEEEDKKLAYRREPFKKVKGDIYFRFTQEKLYLPEEKEFFNDLLELRIDRRGERIVQKCSQRTARLGKSVKRLINERNAEIEKGLYLNRLPAEKISDMENMILRVSDNKNIKYSYAELIHSIFHMTRDEKGYSKELVACILHSYSVYLSELYDEYRNAKLKLGKTEVMLAFRSQNRVTEEITDSDGSLISMMLKDHEIFRGVIGDTVCGRWCEYFFPEVTTTIIGWQRKDRKPAPVILGCCHRSDMRYKFTVQNNDEKIRLAIKAFLFLFMFHKDALEWEKLTFKGTVNNRNCELEFILEEPQDMELTSFFKFVFLYPEFLRKMEELMTSAILGAQQNEKWTKSYTKKIQDALRDVMSELWESFIDWDIKYGNMILPLHNFDLAYNMIKRIFQRTEKRRDSIIIGEETTFLDEFHKMNQLFENYLEDLDCYYGVKSNERRFYTVFKQCPYFKLLEEIGTRGKEGIMYKKPARKQNKKGTDIYLADEVEKIIMDLIADLTSGYEMERSADSLQEGE